MPRKRKNERLRYRYFEWIISRLNGVWRADGRSNRINVGRHSLGTRDLLPLRKLTTCEAKGAESGSIVVLAGVDHFG